MENHTPAPAHTPAPWHVELAPNGEPFVANSARQHVCTLYEKKPVERNAADARLIAAAPDLLESLKELVDRYENDILDGHDTDLIRKAEEIIANAEGH